MNRSHALWITQTAVLIALLVSTQAATSAFIPVPLVRQLVTGSVVNMLLITSVMAASFSTGLTVGIVSPVFASLLAIVPGWQWPLLPVLMLGNASIVTVWHVTRNKIGRAHV